MKSYFSITNAHYLIQPTQKVQRSVMLLMFLAVLSLSCGCATTRQMSLYPPVMELSELRRDYQKIAVIDCSSNRFGNLSGVTSQDYDWAINELRERAHSLGADAVIYPEVRAENDTFLFFPSSRIIAKGIAIRFR